MWRAFLEYTRRLDWVLLSSALALTGIGLAAIYSIDLSRGGELDFFSTQFLALGIGLGVLLVAASWHLARYEKMAPLFFLLTVIVVVSVLFFGVTIRGTRGWFRLFGFSFQPVELAKVALLLFMAWRIERAGRRFASNTFFWSTAVMAGLLIGPILLQPDLGSALVMIALWFFLILAAGINPRTLWTMVGAGLVVFVIAWLFLFKDYQKERLLTFTDPGRDPLGAGYNVNQSIIAIGSGQFWGRGLGFGSQSQLHFLPEAQTDFISAVIGEELGFVGLVLVVSLYAVIFNRLLRIARLARSDFAAYTALGVAILWSVQVGVNTGAALGLLPVTGVTLPLVSYGGSSLITNYLLIGIILSVEAAGRPA